jgi:hypothetical protein
MYPGLFSFGTWIAMRDYTDINLDVPHSSPDIALPFVSAIKELKNETLTSAVVPYFIELSFSKYEHKALHSQTNDSEISFPHSFMNHPIHSIPGDPNSEIVANVIGGLAWDFALRFLLPIGVDGIIAEIENNCGQKFSYHISGSDAFFLGEGSKHETKYNRMKVIRSLSLHTHPNFTTTPGHCYYSIVRTLTARIVTNVNLLHNNLAKIIFVLNFRVFILALSLRHRTEQTHQEFLLLSLL